MIAISLYYCMKLKNEAEIIEQVKDSNVVNNHNSIENSSNTDKPGTDTNGFVENGKSDNSISNNDSQDGFIEEENPHEENDGFVSGEVVIVESTGNELDDDVFE